MRLAAIDLGSNSFRLEIAHVEGDQIVSENSWKETVRLAGGIDREGNLTLAKQEQALQALARIAEKLDGFPRNHVRAVGTQTLRAAKNSDQFIEKAEKVLNCKIEILRGKEEARLVYEGCSYALPASDKRRLIIDIGGGSTECIVGIGHRPMVADSFHVGCVNTSVRFFDGGRISPDRILRAQLAAEAEFAGNIDPLLRFGWDEAYGSSGTAAAVSQVLLTQGISDGTITREGLEAIKREVLSSGKVSDIVVAGLKEDRREVIAGGLAVLLAVFNKFGIKSMKPVGGALRYGILHDLAGRKSLVDPRKQSVDNLIKRFGADPDQAARVSDLAVRFFVESTPEASVESRKLLEWSAQLIEIGLAVSKSDFHKHGEYLIRNCDIPGFSKYEQETMASLVLAQRGNLKKVSQFLENDENMRKVFCLRLATIIYHAKHDFDEVPFQVRIDGRKLRVYCPKQWLIDHPLTDYLLKQEAGIWKDMKFDMEIEAS